MSQAYLYGEIRYPLVVSCFLSDPSDSVVYCDCDCIGNIGTGQITLLCVVVGLPNTGRAANTGCSSECIMQQYKLSIRLSP